MRLTKVQKKLKELGVTYSYEETDFNGNKFGDIWIKGVDTKNYNIGEITSVTGSTVSGIWVSGTEYDSQKEVISWIERNEDKFSKEVD